MLLLLLFSYSTQWLWNVSEGQMLAVIAQKNVCQATLPGDYNFKENRLFSLLITAVVI